MVRLPTALAEHAWLSGERDALPMLLEAPFARAVELGEPWWLGEVAFWLRRVGALDQALTGVAEPYAFSLAGRWREAHDAWMAIGCPYQAAQALACAEEEDPLRKALAAFEQFGARGERDEVARRLRRLGARDIGRTPARVARSTSTDLSARETEVLGLLTDGLRNAQIAEKLFLSERTVEHHVAAILRKLGTRSRLEAAQEARRRGLVGSS